MQQQEIVQAPEMGTYQPQQQHYHHQQQQHPEPAFLNKPVDLNRTETSTVVGQSNANYQPRSFVSRHLKTILAGSVFLTLAATGALVALFIERPWDHGRDSLHGGLDKSGGHKGSLDRFTETSSVQISSMICCNKLTPPLDQPFKYGTEPIRGLNLGGWLVLEPFITPSLFNPYIKQNVTEEYSLTKLLGPEQARELLERHYSTWVTENTFKRIRDLGLNHVRIPLGFWALGDLEKDEPYVPDLALDYLLQGLRWAAQYGIRVMVELHAAPGSQNGWNHSGKMGKIGWLDGTAEGEKNGQRTIEYMKKLLRLLQGPGMDHVSPLFGVLNEPAIFMLDRDRIKQWYKDAFAEMRDITGAGKGPWAVLHDGFLGLNQWEGFMHGADRLALDAHQYLIFDQNLISMSRPEQVKFPCEVWSQDMQRSVLKFGPTLVGEFSSATNDCATYLNGIGAGYRWDGTFMNENGKPGEAACQRSKNNDTDGYCSCDAQNRIGTYTPEYRQFLSEFTQTQMDAFEQGLGWFYWNFKTETNPLWSYFDGVDQGWIPADANNRPGGCAAVGHPITPYAEGVKKD